MDKRVAELIDYTRSKYNLKQFEVHKWEINSSISFYNQTAYTLSMEWLPLSNCDSNHSLTSTSPKETAYIEIDIVSRRAKRMIFRGTNLLVFNTKKDIVQWIEKETGLSYGAQFELSKESHNEYDFIGCINGIPVYPPSYIQLKLDEHGGLILFSTFGHFPKKEEVREELYTLNLSQVEPFTFEQLVLVQLPNKKEKEYVPFYAIEEIYINNNGTTTFPYEFISVNNARQIIDQTMEWNTCESSNFNRKELDMDSYVYTIEQAFNGEQHPDLQPLSEEQLSQCIGAIERFLSMLYPNDSGKWMLKWLFRQNGYIQAVLKHHEHERRLVTRKIVVYIDKNTFEVQNYLDNKQMLDIFDDYKEIGNINVTKMDAFHKLMNVMELEPYYVYDKESSAYVLCGKLDCNYAVNAYDGELVALNNI